MLLVMALGAERDDIIVMPSRIPHVMVVLVPAIRTLVAATGAMQGVRVGPPTHPDIQIDEVTGLELVPVSGQVTRRSAGSPLVERDCLVAIAPHLSMASEALGVEPIPPTGFGTEPVPSLPLAALGAPLLPGIEPRDELFEAEPGESCGPLEDAEVTAFEAEDESPKLTGAKRRGILLGHDVPSNPGTL
jgi:hypothetical protein